MPLMVSGNCGEKGHLQEWVGGTLETAFVDNLPNGDIIDS